MSACLGLSVDSFNHSNLCTIEKKKTRLFHSLVKCRKSQRNISCENIFAENFAKSKQMHA